MIVDEPSPSTSQQITITATQPQGTVTKMVYDNINTDGSNITPKWQANDKFKVFGATGAGTEFENALVDNNTASTTDFTGTLPTGASPYKAFYPAIKAAGTWDGCVLNVSGQTQSGNGNTDHISDFNYMIGTVTVDETSEPYTSNLSFEHQMAMIKFNLTLPDDVADSGDPFTIVLSTDDKSFYSSKEIKSSGSAVPTDKVSLHLTGISTNVINAYMMLIPTTILEGKKMYITVGCAKKIYRTEKTVLTDLEAGKYYTLTIAGGWDDTVTPDWLFNNTVANHTTGTDFKASGAGSSVSPYLISTAMELKYLVQQINNRTGQTNSNWKGKYYKLTTDIHVTADLWSSIGYSSLGFDGNFDGDGHIISGQLNVNADDAGFFGSISNNNSSSITIKNLTVTSNVSVSGAKKYVGGILGASRSPSGKNVTIDNCHFSGNISGAEYCAAGIVGYIDAAATHAIKNCTSRGNIVGCATPQTYDCFGGIVGAVAGTGACAIDYCTNYASITGASTGVSAGGGIDLTSGRVGGIIGQLYTGSVSYCTNYGDIDGSNNLGGIIGRENNSSTNTFKYNKNYGTIGNNSATYVGGITGYNTTTPRYDNNINHSTQIYGTSYVGGIIGRYSSPSIMGSGNVNNHPTLPILGKSGQGAQK